MITQLTGILLAKQPPFIVIDVNGVGYELQVSMMTMYKLPEVEQPITILTKLITREDAQLLYGFHDNNERAIFKELIKISGIGPKLALAILSGLTTEELIDCIINSNSKQLITMPGVGAKTAQRLIVEMQDKFKDHDTIILSNQKATINQHQDAISALVALGYKAAQAQQAIKLAAKNSEVDINSESLIKVALKNLAKS